MHVCVHVPDYCLSAVSFLVLDLCALRSDDDISVLPEQSATKWSVKYKHHLI